MNCYDCFIFVCTNEQIPATNAIAPCVSIDVTSGDAFICFVTTLVTLSSTTPHANHERALLMPACNGVSDFGLTGNALTLPCIELL